jgi:hypothetical protein
MSISVQPKPITWIASNKWKVWRIINSAIILFAFFGPWLAMETDHDTGFRAIMIFENYGMFAFELEDTLSERIRIAMTAFPFFLGLLTILIYCALNIFAAILRVKLTDRLVWKILMLCLLALGGISLLKILNMFGIQDLTLLQWGYWIVVVGLISSVVLEISYFISKRKVRVSHQNIS